MKAEDIFLAALDKKTVAERRAYLDGACGDDALLRAQVESLLHSHQEAGSFLNMPLFDTPPTVDQPLVENSGTRIGQYKLLQQVGEGGFGVVFMAEQLEPVRRKVALKVIKPGMDTRQVIARFEAERQALAMMDHPNIARVMDAGATASGRPYFVMELVRGVPITAYCDQNNLTIRDRLALFASVCQAIQHAHTKGIIHRDIKPSNVLVTSQDGAAAVKVIDFGVAKAMGQQLTDKTLFTDFAQMIGTPLYMSPEQAELSGTDIDTRSDIYSLGVLLYELLTGSTPVDKEQMKKAAFDEIRRLIREEEPPKPSTRISSAEAAPSIAAQRHTEPARLAKLVRGELDWIVMKSLEKDRNRRYETANAFARDIEHFLHDEPVAACPPSAGYRLRKLARRNKVALATATAIAAALIGGIALSTWQAIRATKAETLATSRLQSERQATAAAQAAQIEAVSQGKKAKTNAEEAEAQRKVAEANFVKARKAVDDYFVKVSDSHLLKAHGLQPLRRELLEAALRFYEELTQQRSDDPELQTELAGAHFRVGRIYSELGSSKEAQQAFASAQELYKKLLQQRPVDVELLHGRARCQYWRGKSAEAIASWEQLVPQAPGRDDIRRELADAYNSIAISVKRAGKEAEAIQWHNKAREIREQLIQANPDDLASRYALGQTLNNLGRLLKEQPAGRSADALALFQRALEHGTFAFERAPGNLTYGRLVAIAYGNVAECQGELGSQPQATESYERAIGVWKRLALDNPLVPELQANLAWSYFTLAGYQRGVGRIEEWARLMRLRQQVLARQPTESAGDRYNTACVYAVSSAQVLNRVSATAKELEDAQAEAKEAVDWLQQAIDAGFADLALVRTDEDLDSLRDREDFQKQLVRLEEKHLADQAAGAAKAESDRLAALVKSAEDGSQAGLQAGQELLAIRQKRADAKPESLDLKADVAATQHTIGLIQLNLSRFDEATQSLAQAEIARRALVAAIPQQVSYRADLAATILAQGDLEWRRGHLAPGAAHWKQALSVLDEVVQAEPGNNRFAAQVAAAQFAVGNCYGELGLWREAALHHGRAFAAQPAGNGYYWPITAYVSLYVGDRETYERVCRQALERSKSSIDRRLLSDLTACMSLSPNPPIETNKLVEMAQKVLAIEPNATWRRFRVSLAQYRAGQYAAALKTVEGPASGNTDVWPVKAMIYHHLGQPQAARQELEKLDRYLDKKYQAALAGESGKLEKPWAWYSWVMLELLRREAHEVVDGRPFEEGPLVHLQRARSYARLEQMEQSEAEFAAALRSAGDNAQVLLAHANVLDRLGRHVEAEAVFERTAALRPNDPTLWLERSRDLVEHGDLAKAEAALTKAAAISPNELHHFLKASWWGSAEPITEGPLAPADADAPKKWHRVATAEFGRLDFQGVSELKSLPSAYVANYVYSPDTRSVTVLLGSAARMRLEVNGELVYEGSGRIWEWGLIPVPVLLRPGRNTLVVTVSNPDQWQACILRIADSAFDHGYLLAQLGLLDEALSLWKPELGRNPTEAPFVSYHYAAMLVAEGRLDDYRQLSSQLQQQAIPGAWDAPRLMGASALAPVDEAVAARLVEQIDEASKRNPANEHTVVMKSLIYYRANRFRDVLGLLENPESLAHWIRGKAYVLRALCQHALGNVKQARADLAKADEWGTARMKMTESVVPEAPGLRGYNGIFELIDHVILSREAHQRIAGDASPHDRELEDLTSSLRSYLNESDQLTAAFDRAILMEPAEARHWIARYRALCAAGRKEQAERGLERLVRAAPDKLAGWKVRGRLYAELGQHAEAAETFAKSLALTCRADTWSAGPHRQLCAEIAQWPEVFDRVVKLLPDDQILWLGRAYWHSQHGRWKEAATDMSKLNDADLLYDETCAYAGLKQLQGQQQDYREITRAFIDRLGGSTTNNQWAGLYLAKTCTLSASLPAEHSQVVAWAETGASGEKKQGLDQFVLGLAYYRAGEWERALGPLDEAAKTWVYGRHPAEKQQVELVRAMCEFRLDQTEQARQRFKTACDLIDQVVPYTRDDPFVIWPSNWISLNILRREAEALIKPEAGKK